MSDLQPTIRFLCLLGSDLGSGFLTGLLPLLDRVNCNALRLTISCLYEDLRCPTASSFQLFLLPLLYTSTPTNNSSYIGRVISFYFVFVFVFVRKENVSRLSEA